MKDKMETNKEVAIKKSRRILSKPLSVREQWALCDEDAYLEGIVSVTPAEFAANDLNGILTLLSERLVGPVLTGRYLPGGRCDASSRCGRPCSWMHR